MNGRIRRSYRHEMIPHGPVFIQEGPNPSLIVELHEGENFQGEYRYIIADVADLSSESGTDYFEDYGAPSGLGWLHEIQSAKIYCGPRYAELIDQYPDDNPPFVRFWEDKQFRGSYIDLGPGFYPQLTVFPFNVVKAPSSIQFLGPPSPILPEWGTIRLVAELYADINLRGQKRTIITNESNLGQQDFAEKTRSLRVMPGPAYEQGWVVRLYREPYFVQAWPIDFEAGQTINDLSIDPHDFSQKAKSIRITNE